MTAKRFNEVRRRNFIKAIGSTGAAGMIAGCSGQGGNTTTSSNGGNSGSPDGSSSKWPDLRGHSIHFVGAEGSEAAKRYWNKVNSAFSEATGAKVNMEYAGSVTGNRLAQLIQAGNPPELYNSTEVQASNLAVQNAIVPVTDVMDKVINRMGQPMDFQSVVYESDHYYVPFFGNASQYWYRTDLGIDIVPDTWDKVLEYTKQADKVNAVQNGTIVSAGPGFDTQRTALTWGWSAGAKVAERDSNGEVQVALHKKYRSNWVEALGFMDNLHQYSPTASDSGWSMIGNGIQSSLCAGNWYGGGRPIQYAVENDRPFASSVQSVLTPENANRIGQGSGNGLIVPKGSDTEAAMTYIDFLMTTDQIIDLAFDIAPVHNALIYPKLKNTSQYKKKIEALPEAYKGEGQLNRSILEAPANARSYPTETSPPNPYAGALADSLLISQMVQEVLLQDVNPGTAVDKYGEELQDVLDSTRM